MIFFLFFMLDLANSWAPKPQVLLFSTCAMTACSMQDQDCFGKKWDIRPVC